jgi:hypothetical protein
MVNVTMMRGAQSGGVVLFEPKKHKHNASSTTRRSGLQGIRSRVLNKKRTDLSQEIRKRVANDLPKSFPKDFVPTLSGHTRFATSSKASLEGTHPQQWTPASQRRVYDMSVPIRQEGKVPLPPPSAQSTSVENYITHNGDFDFYIVNGQTYDLEIVQKWVSVMTGIPTPASVDSCAIAGVVDLLRTQGSFGLSARYAICFALSTSCMDDSLEGSFPSFDHFETIGTVFETMLDSKLDRLSLQEEGVDLHAFGDNPAARNKFALDMVTALESRIEELIQPLAGYINLLADGEEEQGANLYAFCIATINAFFDNDLLFSTKEFLKNAKGSFGLCVTSSLDAHRQICFAARGQTVGIVLYSIVFYLWRIIHFRFPFSPHSGGC